MKSKRIQAAAYLRISADWDQCNDGCVECFARQRWTEALQSAVVDCM